MLVLAEIFGFLLCVCVRPTHRVSRQCDDDNACHVNYEHLPYDRMHQDFVQKSTRLRVAQRWILLVAVGRTLISINEVIRTNSGATFAHPELFTSNSSQSTTTPYPYPYHINHNGSPQFCTSWRLTRIDINKHTQHGVSRLQLHNPRQSSRPRHQRHTLQENTSTYHQHILIYLRIGILHRRIALSQRHRPRPHHTHQPPPSHPRHPRSRSHRHTSAPRALLSNHPPARHSRH